MRLLPLFLAAGLFQDPIETALSRKSAESGWAESIVSQALTEIQESCGRRMSATPPTPSAEKFRRIAQQLLPRSGRRAVEVQFLDCRRQITAVTLGAIIVVDTGWIARASEDDLWAVAAHEMAHRPSDFARRVVIGLHVPGLRPADKDDLVTEMELKADAGAVFLLRSAGRDPNVLRRFLEAESRRSPSAQLTRRLAAL